VLWPPPNRQHRERSDRFHNRVPLQIDYIGNVGFSTLGCFAASYFVLSLLIGSGLSEGILTGVH